MDWIELIAGSVIGTAMGYYFPVLKKKIIDTRLHNDFESRKAAFTPENIYQWLIDYYNKNQKLNDLYNCKIGKFERRIPFITNKVWQVPIEISKDKNDILSYTESEESQFHVNNRLIEKRRNLGQTLFNEPILFLDYIQQGEDGIIINAKKCDYFQAITSLMELEEETYKSFKKGNHKNLKFRDRCLASFEVAQQVYHRPLNLGCISSLVIKNGTSHEILINTRSYELVTYGGAKAVIPQFGLIPVDGEGKAQNLIFYNYIKEYCEELFSYDELIRKSDVKRVSPTWFYRLEQAQSLLELWDNKLFTLNFLGFGFDALNGGAIISLLAFIEDENFGNKLKSKINANWEVQKKAEQSIEFVDLGDPRLEKWLREKKLQYGSAFTIARTIEKLGL